MANVFSGNPLSLTAVQAAAYPPAVGYIDVVDMTWMGMTDAAGAGGITLKDRNGLIIVQTVSQGADNIQRFGRIGMINGEQLTAISSGTLSIFIK